MSAEKVVNVKTGKLESCHVGAGCKRHAHNLSDLKPLDLEFEDKYYLYSQNNSGGSFKSPAKNIIVKASSASQANKIAEDNGVYFDENYEIDCSCCGTRWSQHDDNSSYDVFPTLQKAKDNAFVLDFDKEIPDFLIIEEQ